MEHEPVAANGEVYVIADKKPVVPVLVCVLLGKERRKQVDELLTFLDAEFAPDGNLSTVAIIIEKLVWPGIYHDRQRDIVLGQEIGKFLHIP